MWIWKCSLSEKNQILQKMFKHSKMFKNLITIHEFESRISRSSWKLIITNIKSSWSEKCSWTLKRFLIFFGFPPVFRNCWTKKFRKKSYMKKMLFSSAKGTYLLFVHAWICFSERHCHASQKREKHFFSFVKGTDLPLV